MDKRRKRKKSFKTWFSAIVVLLLLIGYYVYQGGRLIRAVIGDHMIKTKAVYIKAVIIDKTHFNPNSSMPEEWYSYRFYLDDKAYEGESLDPKYRVGDSIDVEYVRGWPAYNRPAHQGKQ